MLYSFFNIFYLGLGYVRVGMELGWGGFDRAKLDMLMLIRIPFSFHVLLSIIIIVWIWGIFALDKSTLTPLV